MRKLFLLLLIFSLNFILPNNSPAQSCAPAVFGNYYTVTSDQPFGYGSLYQCIGQANADNVGGIIVTPFFSTLYLFGAMPQITVDSLQIFPDISITLDAQSSAFDPVFTFAASASHSCIGTNIIIINTLPGNIYVTNTDDSGPGSLRDAINGAEQSASKDNIKFDIPGMAPQVIHPLSQYLIHHSLNIDGSSQPANGYTGTAPKIELDGDGLGNDCFDFLNYSLSSTSVDVYGMNIHDFNAAVYVYYASSFTMGASGKQNVISGCQGVDVQQCRNITIQNNFIGTDTSGSIAAGNETGLFLLLDSNVLIKDNLISGNSNGVSSIECDAISIKGNKVGTDVSGMFAIPNENVGLNIDASSASVIGGTIASDGNLISGNGLYPNTDPNGGIMVVDHVKIIGNKIGTDVTGTYAIPNIRGVEIAGSSNVGGTTASERNLISGNTVGIYLYSGPVEIAGNYIGTDVTGSIAIPNSNGISFNNYFASDTLRIHDNLVSGNTNTGMGVFAFSSGYNIYRNKIGVDASGQTALPNADGIFIGESHGGIIGGNDTTFANIISGNTGNGILFSYNTDQQPIVRNNIIGMNASQSMFIPNQNGIFLSANNDGTMIDHNTIAGNSGHGILIGGVFYGMSADNNDVDFNIIHDNGLDGIHCTSQQNTFSQNSIYDNGGKGINLDTTGNNNIAQIVMLQTNAAGASGTSMPYATIELFYSQSQNNNPQGKTFIASVTADATGNWNYSGSLSSPCDVTATETDGSGNTSEFLAVVYPSPFSLGPDTVICEGASYTIFPDNSYNYYVWNTGDTTSTITVTTTGSYTLAASNVEGCAVSDTIFVTVTPCLLVDELPISSFTVYPNPAQDKFFIEVTSFQQQQANFSLNDAAGRIVIEQQEILSKGRNIIPVRVVHLAKGVYVFELFVNEKMEHRLMMIE